MGVNVRDDSRRRFVRFLGGCGLLLVGAGACRSPMPAAEPFSPRALGKKGSEKVLVFLPEDGSAAQFWNSISSELNYDFHVVPVLVKEPSPDVFARVLAEHDASCVVLVENGIVRAYRDYQGKAVATAFPPSVVVHTAFAEEMVQALKNSTGVSYEIPVATSVSVLRKVLTDKVQSVGVVYRSGLREFVARQHSFAAEEKVELVGAEVSKSPSVVELRTALRHLLREKEVDAMWVLNDNSLLRPEMLREAWLPALRKRRVPTIVGVSNLLSPGVGFGTLAIEPDAEGLGHQAANIVYNLQAAEWRAENRVDYPLSTLTTVDVDSARKYFGLHEEGLEDYAVVTE